MSKEITRGNAVKAFATAATVFQVVPRRVLGGNGYVAPNDLITRGVIGIGMQGGRHLGYNTSGNMRKSQAKLVAVSDVDTIRMDKKGKKVRKYQDLARTYRSTRY